MLSGIQSDNLQESLVVASGCPVVNKNLSGHIYSYSKHKFEPKQHHRHHHLIIIITVFVFVFVVVVCHTSLLWCLSRGFHERFFPIKIDVKEILLVDWLNLISGSCQKQYIYIFIFFLLCAHRCQKNRDSNSLSRGLPGESNWQRPYNARYSTNTTNIIHVFYCCCCCCCC